MTSMQIPRQSASSSSSSPSSWWLSPIFTHSLVALAAAGGTYAAIAFKLKNSKAKQSNSGAVSSSSSSTSTSSISSFSPSSVSSSSSSLSDLDNPDSEAWFLSRASSILDFIASYRHRLLTENTDSPSALPIRSRVEPGYLFKQIPACAPELPEKWEEIEKDICKVILPGITHWASPHFAAYYPAVASYPSFIGDMLSTAFNVIGFSWISSPALTELEALVTDWLGKLINLPSEFLMQSGKGGGAIHGAAGEAAIVAILAAKQRAMRNVPSEKIDEVLGKLVAYSSDQTHGICIKACKIIGIPLRNLRVIKTERYHEFQLTKQSLQSSFDTDIAAGLLPFFCCLTFGTTSSATIDPIGILAPLCQKHNVFVHIDAAYAGSYLLLPECRELLMQGVETIRNDETTGEVELVSPRGASSSSSPFSASSSSSSSSTTNPFHHVDSFNMNPHKTLLTAMDCSILWVKDRRDLVQALSTSDMEFLKNTHSTSGAVSDLKDWGLAFGRRFRSLKLWMVLRCYGAEGIRQRLRKTIETATWLEQEGVGKDPRFQLQARRLFSLVCFRLKLPSQQQSVNDPPMSPSARQYAQITEKTNRLNQLLVDEINASGKIFLVSTSLGGETTVRFATSSIMTLECVQHDWKVIQETATKLLANFTD